MNVSQKLKTFSDRSNVSQKFKISKRWIIIPTAIQIQGDRLYRNNRFHIFTEVVSKFSYIPTPDEGTKAETAGDVSVPKTRMASDSALKEANGTVTNDASLQTPSKNAVKSGNVDNSSTPWGVQLRKIDRKVKWIVILIG